MRILYKKHGLKLIVFPLFIILVFSMFFSVNVLHKNSANNDFSTQKTISSNVIPLAGEYETIAFFENNLLGKMIDVCVANSIAYVLGENKLFFYNISNPLEPILENTMNIRTDIQPSKIIYNNNKLYCTYSAYDEIYIIDVADIMNPNLYHAEYVNGGKDIDIDGDFFYCTTGFNVEIHDLENLGDQFNLGYIYFSSELVRGIDACNDFLYIGTKTGLMIYSFQNPENPVKKSELILDKIITDIVYANDYVYLTSKENDYTIIDVSNKSNPIELSELEINRGVPIELVISGNTTIIATTRNYSYEPYSLGGIIVINHSNPLNPKILSTFSDGGLPVGLSINGSSLFVIEEVGDGLEIFDLSTPANPIKLTHTCGGVAQTLENDNDFVFIAERWGGIKIINCSDSLNPTFVSQYDAGGDIVNFEVANNLLFIANLELGLEIVDISNIENPVRIGLFFDGGNALDVCIVDDYLFLADGFDGVEIIDISNPNNPLKINQINTYLAATEISVKDEFIYVLETNLFNKDSSSKFTIIDITDINSPQITDSITMIRGSSFAIIENIAYIAAIYLKIVDISNPHEIVVLENIDDNGFGGLYLAGKMLFAYANLEYTYGTYAPVKIYDISESENPVKIAAYGTEKYYTGFSENQEYIYAIERDNTMEIISGDFDFDGLSNQLEKDFGTDPFNKDTDADGLIDGDEVNFHKTNPLDWDTDDDTISDGDEVNIYGTDPLVADTDGDGFSDGEEVDRNTDPNNPNSYPHFPYWTISLMIIGLFIMITSIVFGVQRIKSVIISTEGASKEKIENDKKKLFRILFFLDDQSEVEIRDLSANLKIREEKIVDILQCWQKSSILKRIGNFTHNNERILRIFDISNNGDKHNCFYCSTEFNVKETTCPDCGYEPLICHSCMIPIKYNELIIYCEHCKIPYHLEHLIMEIKAKNICPSCRKYLKYEDLEIDFTLLRNKK